MAKAPKVAPRLAIRASKGHQLSAQGTDRLDPPIDVRRVAHGLTSHRATPFFGRRKATGNRQEVKGDQALALETRLSAEPTG